MVTADLLGHRVILADATERTRDALGTVINTADPYAERGLVLVRHEDGRDRWRSPSVLRVLGEPDAQPTSLETLAHDLWFLPASSVDPRVAALHEQWRRFPEEEKSNG